jgi:hypothetical protein
MYCAKCGCPIDNNQRYCAKCGNLLSNEVINNNVTNQNQFVNNNQNVINYQAYQQMTPIPHKQSNHNNKLLIAVCSISAVFVILIIILITSFSGSVYLGNGSNITNQPSTTVTKGSYKTSINYDNTYENISISTMKDAINLIKDDSKKEKNKCSNSSITKIENSIMNNYNITAVNLCELDENFAKELENVVKTIYDNYPKARGYLTNLTLTNTTISNQYIAVFIGTFAFASSNTADTYPWVFKTLIGLNSTYFLNPKRLEASVIDASKSGHFPKNATKYSPLAHEFGHYLSFLSTMKTYNINSLILIDDDDYMDFYDMVMNWSDGTHSKSLINEAYNNYKQRYKSNITELEFRQSISDYAVAKDEEGNYIYDETIAEAFHDCYLNGSNATKASIEIINVLTKQIEGLK